MNLPHRPGAIGDSRRGQGGGLPVQEEPLLAAGLQEEPVDVVFDLFLRLRQGKGVIQNEEPARQIIKKGAHPPGFRVVIPRGVVEKGVEKGVHRSAQTRRHHFGQLRLRSPGKLQIVGPAADVPNGAFPPLGSEDHLPGREEHEFGQFFDRPLGGLIEQADRFQLVAEKLHTKRMPGHRGKEIDHVPPDAELPPPLHQRHPGIAPFHELAHQFIPLAGIAYGDPLPITLKDVKRDDFLHEGAGGDHDDGGFTECQAMENLQAGEFRLPLKGKHVGGQQIPGRHQKREIIAEEEGKIPETGLRLFFRRDDHDERPPEMPEKKGNKKGPGRTLQTADRNPVLPSVNPLQKLPDDGISGLLYGSNDFSHSFLG